MNTLMAFGILLPLLVAPLCGQAAPGFNGTGLVTAPLDAKVEHFDLADSALIDGMAELSSKPVPGLHLGIEEILRPRLADARDRSVRFSLHLENRTVREILDALCQSDSRYEWSADGPSINVYPRARANDPSYLLDVPLEWIRVSDIPDPDQALVPLAKQVSGQQIGYMQLGGDNRYASPWTATFEHLTVRQFINRVAEHMGPRTSWIWQGGRDSRMFTFLKGSFHTQ
jgi:hypothetical protein